MQIYLSGEETYASGDIIIEQGSTVNSVYIVLEGRARVTKRTKAGIVTIDTLKPGAIFGEMALFGKLLGGRSASAIVADGPVRLGVLNSQLLRRDYEFLSPRLRLLIDTLIVKLEESSEKAAAFVVAASSKDQASI